MFNPTSLDCEQWCRIAKAAGAKDTKKGKKVIWGTTIGQKKIITFPAYKTSELQFELADYRGNWSSLKEIGTYLIDEKLIKK